ncbi:MAG: DnaJ domain-containing protein [Acidobacteriaceae bacterium]|nr:DnaJ domain-containing protein [Acidobacteriaceae bacterium]
MQVNRRREPRRPSEKSYSISWQDDAGLTRSAQVRGTNASDSGLGIRCPSDIRPGTSVYIQGEDGTLGGYCVVRHSSQRGGAFVIGLELDEAARKSRSALTTDEEADHYEFLQISPNAQPDTIQRVYRFLASRYHPDNPESGDPEKFLHLNRAYEVLSDPERRAEYDESLTNRRPQPSAVFESVDFLDGVEGEVNRRLAVLSLLYRKCRADINNPHVSLLDLEAQMGFPREYLDFTLWYLRHKKYVSQEDGAELALTTLGVDYVEANYTSLPLMAKLLSEGSRSSFRSDRAETRKAPAISAARYMLGPAEPADVTQ